MGITETDKKDLENLVQKIPLAKHETNISIKAVTKKHIRKIAEPHLQAHKTKVKGQNYIYYTYRWGSDKEIYLGDADFILTAVRKFREEKK